MPRDFFPGWGPANPTDPTGTAPSNNPWANFGTGGNPWSSAGGGGSPTWGFPVTTPSPAPVPTNVAQYAMSLRPAVAAGLSGIPLAATLQEELARQISLRGPLDPALVEAVGRTPALQDIRDAYTIADSLAQTRTDIQITTQSGVSAVPRTPSTGASVLSGAASGAAIGGAVGGPIGAGIGAGVGAVGGLLQHKGARSSARATTRDLEKRGAAAMAATEPAAVQATLAGLAPSQRELVAAGGYGQSLSQDLEAAISRSGLRDSGAGALGGLAAAVAPEQLARTQTISQGLAHTRRAVETIMGQPVRPGVDRLTEALGAVTEGFLTYKSLFPTQKKTTADLNSPTPTSPMPAFSSADEPLYTPAGGWSWIQ